MERHLEQYRQVSKRERFHTLLYCLGEEADDVLNSANPTEEERKDYTAIMAKLDGYFQVRKNTIYERARFNRRNQLEGKSAEQYITALYGLIGNCEYGPLKEELLRDRMVVGIRDTALWQKLQADAGLTLERAKTAIRQKEAITEQQTELGGNSWWKQSTADHKPEEVRQHSSYPQKLQRGGARGGRPMQASNVHAVVAKYMHQGSDVQSLRQSVINAIVWVISVQSVFLREQQWMG